MSVAALFLIAALLTGQAAEEAAPPVEPTPVPAATVEAAHELLMPALVRVRIDILEEREAFFEERTAFENIFDEFVRQRIPLHVSGVCIAPDGIVLIRDPNLPLRRYEKIEATDSDDRITEMEVLAILENHAGVLLKPKTPMLAAPHVEFAETEINAGDTLNIGYVTLIEDMLTLDVQPTNAAMIVVNGRERLKDLLWWDVGYGDALSHLIPTAAPIILDSQFKPVGVGLDNGLWHSVEGIDSFAGNSILADRRITPAMLDETTKTIETQAETGVREVAIQFRDDSAIGRQLTSENNMLHFYGLLLDSDGRILLPTEFDWNVVRQMEKFLVKDGDRQVEAEFLGSFREFGGLLIRAKGLSGAPAQMALEADVPRGRVFFTMSVRWKYGERRERVEYNRYLDMKTGYKEARYPVPRKPIAPGDLVADMEGRFIGFCAPYRQDERDAVMARYSQRASQDNPNRIFFFSEIAETLKDPQKHFDPSARPMSRKEELGTVWFGIEYQPMTPALARAFNAETATRGGSRGLLVTQVYDESPAAGKGIKTGDILVSIKAAGIPSEIDMTIPQKIAEAEERFLSGRSPRPWRPRVNFLVQLLTRLGPGRNVQFNMIRDGKEMPVSLALETAPDNYDTADEYRAADLDLTIRNLTYEVRSLLRLPKDAPGVIVSEVNPGGKSALAGIRSGETIVQVNGIVVSDISEFEKALNESRGQGRTALVITTLGHSRIVEVDTLAP